MPAQQRSSSLISKQVSIQTAQKPQFTKHLQNLTVKQGNRAVFECYINGSPDTEVKWYKNSILIEPSTDYIIEFDRITGLSTLTILEVFVQDSGQYTCVASNNVGSESSTAWMVVKTPSPEKVVEMRESVRKIISAKFHEQPKTQPIRMGPIESTRIELPVSPTKPVEFFHPIQKSSVEVPAAPAVRLEPVDKQMTKPTLIEPLRNSDMVEGGQVVFECKIIGNPLNIKWYKGDTELKNQYRHRITYDEKTGVARLVITTVFEDDIGQYTCVASNPLGQVNTSSKLAPSSNFLFLI